MNGMPLQNGMFGRKASLRPRRGSLALPAIGVALACVGCWAAPAFAATPTYSFSGTISFVSTMNASLPSDISYGREFTGLITLNDATTPSVQTYPNGSSFISVDGEAVLNLSVTVGNATYTKANVINYYGDTPGYTLMTMLDGFGSSFKTDFLQVEVNTTSYSHPTGMREAALKFQLQANGGATNPPVITSPSLANLDLVKFLEPAVRSQWNEIRFEDVGWIGNTYNTQAYRRIFEGTITKLEKGISVGAVSSGTVAVPSGQQYNVSTASGGVINSFAGTAQVGTLAGATLNTGAGGAIVNTLTSGTVNTTGGSIATQGGTFTGLITGNGGVTMSGTGTLVMSSPNSYTGGTLINAGTVEITRGDAIGSAPVRVANNGKFRAMQGVSVANTVVMSGSAVYEHLLSGSDSITNLAPVRSSATIIDIVAGDSGERTVTSVGNADGSLDLHGLDGTRFLMVMDMSGYIPKDAQLDEYYLGWYDATANANAGGWVNAVYGNHGPNGSLAGGYEMSYAAFLSTYGGWNRDTMLGAYGLDVANGQVWAVIDHNSDFGVASDGVLVVPEPATFVLLGSAGLAWLAVRRRRGRRD